MKTIFIVLAIVGLVGIFVNESFSQEIGLATFQETAQVIIDKSISESVYASITLQSTSNQEIRIPSEFEQKVRENDRIAAIVVTNQDNCIIGVVDQACILINVTRDEADKGIAAIQESTKKIGSLFIDDVNSIFDTNAEFHSVYIHTSGEANEVLETSGVVSGRGVISAVYTMPQESTDSMYEKLSAILIHKVIRDAGGFYDAAINLSKENNAKMTFSMIPLDSASLFQLRLTAIYPETATEISEVSPLEFLKTEQLNRSEYFSSGFYPLNSLLQVVVLSPESEKISDMRAEIVPTELFGNEKVPTDVTEAGWVFDPEQGERIQGKYLFGQDSSVDNNELIFTLGETKITEPIHATENLFDESIIIVIVIVIGAVGATVFYLRGYKKN